MTTLAIDLGTSAIKFMRVDAGLNIVGTDRVPVSGLNVETWLDAIRQNLHSHDEGHSIRSIAITGQMHGLLTLEETGYSEGIPWTDQQGAAMVPWLNETFGPDIAMRTGGPIASGFQVASLAWLKSHDPARWHRIQKVMLPKDALIHALTGQHLTDPSDAAGTGMYDVRESEWAWDIVDGLAIPHDWLPPVVPSGSEVGPVRAAIARHLGLNPGTSVVIAGGDAPVGAIGARVTGPDQALIMLSSGAQIILPTHTYQPDPQGRWYAWPAARSKGGAGTRYLRVGTLLNAGIATSWLRSVLAEPDLIPPAPTHLIALPHLIGERTPLRDPHARGAILGIGPETSAGELSRAMLEGVAYALRHALDVMCVSMPRPSLIRLGGGGAQHEPWQAIITNVLGIPTERVATDELSAYGAALLASHGEHTTLPGLATKDHRTKHPDPAIMAQYEDLYAIYRDALEAIAPLSHWLAALKTP